MRELVYVSQGKLQQFTSARLRRRRIGRSVEAEIKTPIASFKIGKNDNNQNQSHLDLETVIAELERSPRSPKWYEDPSVQPGQWIHFEAPLSYTVMPANDFLSAVIFMSSPTEQNGWPEASTPIVLHGSSSNLIETAPQAIPDIDLDGMPMGDPSSTSYFYREFDVEKRFQLKAAARELGQDSGEVVSTPQYATDLFSLSVATIIDVAGLKRRGKNSAWMRGYARVTGRAVQLGTRTPMVIASPLHVERADPPTMGAND